jgi:hypothetical protein
MGQQMPPQMMGQQMPPQMMGQQMPPQLNNELGLPMMQQLNSEFGQQMMPNMMGGGKNTDNNGYCFIKNGNIVDSKKYNKDFFFK